MTTTATRLQGGSWLVSDTTGIFTPERLNEDHRLIASTALAMLFVAAGDAHAQSREDGAPAESLGAGDNVRANAWGPAALYANPAGMLGEAVVGGRDAQAGWDGGPASSSSSSATSSAAGRRRGATPASQPAMWFATQSSRS